MKTLKFYTKLFFAIIISANTINELNSQTLINQDIIATNTLFGSNIYKSNGIYFNAETNGNIPNGVYYIDQNESISLLQEGSRIQFEHQNNLILKNSIDHELYLIDLNNNNSNLFFSDPNVFLISQRIVEYNNIYYFVGYDIALNEYAFMSLDSNGNFTKVSVFTGPVQNTNRLHEDAGILYYFTNTLFPSAQHYYSFDPSTGTISSITAQEFNAHPYPYFNNSLTNVNANGINYFLNTDQQLVNSLNGESLTCFELVGSEGPPLMEILGNINEKVYLLLGYNNGSSSDGLYRYPQSLHGGLCQDSCDMDSSPPICNNGPFTVQLDSGQDYYTFDINDFASDACSPILTYENASLDPSTPNGNFTHFWSGTGDQFQCGTYIVTSSFPFDDAGNFNDCAFTFTVDCAMDTCTNAALDFDGVDDKVVVSSPLSGDSDYTISLDFKCGPQINGPYNRLIGFTNFQSEIAVNDTSLYYYNGNAWSPNLGINVADSIWHNVTITKGNGETNFYLDGNILLVGSSPVLDFNDEFIIGHKYNNSSVEYFNGEIDNVKIWDFVLDSNEVCNNIVANDTPNILFYNFDEGEGGMNNSGILGPIDLVGGDNNGVFNNFSLSGNSSNYLCVEYHLACDNNCANDTILPNCFSQNINVSLDQNNQVLITPEMIDNGSSDNCSDVELNILGPNLFDCSNIGENTIYLNVSDASGNIDSCLSIVAIEDKIPPVINCINQVIEYPIDISGSVNVTLSEIITASDNCGEVVITGGNGIYDCTHLTAVPLYYTMTATDDAGLQSTCQQGFIITDPNGYCKPYECPDVSCPTNVIDLSTGLDNNNTLLPIGQYVGNWQLIDGPDPTISYPRPGYVLNPNVVWDQLPGSQYISPFPNASNNESFSEPYVFERCFCVCQPDATVQLDIAAYVDNFINIGLYDDIGNVIQADLIDYQNPPDANTFLAPAFTSNTIHELDAGTYCLRAGLRNDGSVTMGMEINAVVTGAGFIESKCCLPYSIITGLVFNDVGCDGVNNLNQDEGISNIELFLTDLEGNIVTSTMSDVYGYYVFNDVPEGEYLITQEQIPNMSLTLGDNGYQITMTDNSVFGDLDFGNCMNQDTCCATSETLTNEVESSINSSIISFEQNEVLIVFPELFECQYISKIWWGDGEVNVFTNQEDQASHYYSSNGAYTISIEVTAISDGETICQIDIVDKCVLINDCTSSIDWPNQSIHRLKVYPIPFTSSFSIDLSSNINGYSVFVYNSQGQIIDELDITKNILNFDYNGDALSNGVYILRLEDKDNHSVLETRIIKTN